MADPDEQQADFVTPGLFDGLTRLSFLNLKHNRFVALRSDVFADLTNLEDLWLRNNQLTIVDNRWFEGKPNLDATILDFNPISEIPSGAFRGAERLRRLWLGKTLLSSIETGAFDGLSGLRELLVDANRLETLRPDTFRGLRSVARLWLAENNLSETRRGLFSDLTELRQLLLGRNRFRTMPEDLFSGTPRLQQLYLDEGQLSSLPAGVFESLEELEELRLQGNNLDALPPGVFQGLERLEDLRLHRNSIATLREGVFSDLPMLQLLTLSDNGLAELPASTFKNVDRLADLYMRRNDLSYVPPATFSNLPNLGLVQLSFNSLQALPEGLYAGIRPGVGINLAGNPGGPFELMVETRRVDASDPAAPGPARVRLELPEGAPTTVTATLSVAGGTISSGAAVLQAGTQHTEAFRVERGSGVEGGTAVVIKGRRPTLPAGSGGVSVRWGGPLILFAPESANRSPIAVGALPPLRGLERGVDYFVDVSAYFTDPDGDSLEYSVRSSDVTVADASVAGSEVTVTGLADGSATVWVKAVDPSGQTSEEEGIDILVGDEAFDIELVFVGPESPYDGVIERAAARWEQLIPYGLPDAFIREEVSCDGGGGEVGVVEQLVDDLVIYVAIRNIDGDRGIVGSAAPCYAREEGITPFVGAMAFDAADVGWMAEEEWLEDVALHEIGHVLGIGTVWSDHGLLQNPSLPDNLGADTHFSGTRAVAAFNEAGGSTYTGGKVPVENRYGSGSGDSHWREAILGNELMTSRIGGSVNPLSRITVESLADLGYRVSFDGADRFELDLEMAGARQEGPTIELVDDILPIPLRIVDEQGRVVRIIQRSP